MTAPEYQEVLQCTFATPPLQQPQLSTLEQSQLSGDLQLVVADRPPSRASTSSESDRPASRASNFGQTKTVNGLERWDDKYVKLLISCYSDHKHLFGKGKTTKRDIFGKIAYSFNEQCDVMVTGDQCMRKWIKLESKFKEIEDHNNHTGNDKKTMKFHEELSECLGSDPKVTPVLTLESANNGTEQSDSEDESSDAARAKVKRPPRKRKSHSSATEMLSFMKDYTAKREKVEEEKVRLMREMQEEKKTFFSQMLEIMKNK